jgi:transposase-like protein
MRKDSRYFSPAAAIDETHLKVRGRWDYLYRAADRRGRTSIFC